MDNSDPPSIVEQLSQGPSFSYNTFISDGPTSLMYPMPYALFLASCSMDSPMFLLLFLDLTFPSLRLLSCSPLSLPLGILPLKSGIACLVMCTLG